MPRKTLAPDAADINSEMREEDFWNVGFTYDLRKAKTPEVKAALHDFRFAAKKLAKVVGYPL